MKFQAYYFSKILALCASSSCACISVVVRKRLVQKKAEEFGYDLDCTIGDFGNVFAELWCDAQNSYGYIRTLTTEGLTEQGPDLTI